jgi:tetratricopeptide (TPR) repeat protein
VQKTNNPTANASCLIVMAFHAFLTRDEEAFRDHAREASEAGRRAGNSLMISIGQGFEAWALSLLGQHDEAEQRLVEAYAEAEKIGGRLVAADWIAAASAGMALNAGRPEEAITRAQAAIEKAQAIGGIFGEGLAQRTWAEALVRLDKPDHAESDAHIARALELFELGACALEVAHTHRAWADLLRDRDDWSGAVEHLQQAADRYKAAGLATLAKEARAALRAAQKETHGKG